MLQQELLIEGWLVGCFGFISGRLPKRGLVGCFGFNGPLRQHICLYRAVSQREGESGKIGWLVVLGLTAL